jgi:hypothetical protein
MKLSDFGLCKPIDCSKLSTLNEDEPMGDDNLRESMDIDSSFSETTNGRRWRSQHEQLQHWQMNRRKLVCLLYSVYNKHPIDPVLSVVLFFFHDIMWNPMLGRDTHLKYEYNFCYS